MNKADLIEEVSKQTGYAKKQVTDIVEYMLDIVTKSLQDKKEVSLTGFGTFSAKFRHERWGVNPQNPSERIRIPAVIVPKFKAGKSLKDALKEKATSEESPQEEKPVEQPTTEE